MGLKKLPIRLKIMILSFGIVLFSLLIGGITVIGNIYHGEEEQLGDRGLMTGRIVANLPEVKEGLAKPNGWEVVNPAVEQMQTVNQVDYIVVLNMNRIRYSHPLEHQLGTISSGKDEGAAFAEHSYVSKAKGEQGTAVRSFVPVMNEDHEQIGVVIVGNMLPSFPAILSSIRLEIMVISLLILAFGITGAYLLAKHVKQQTFFMEPYEMARVLEERTTVFQAMHEGVIAVDRDEKIVVFNDKAKEILGIHQEVSGKLLKTILSGNEIIDHLRKQSKKFNETVRIDDRLIMLNRIPIKVEKELVGSVVIFQDKTDVTTMAEELTGVKAFVDALRVQNHEYMNKLHTIAGLIQLDQNEQALEYVFQITNQQEKRSKYILERIHNYRIAGLLISKIRRGEELGIEVTLHESSQLEAFPPMVNAHDFVRILGNMIENSFDALKAYAIQGKHVEIVIIQDSETCILEVSDNGKGIILKDQQHIFQKGYTTKGEDGSGLGLYLIKQIVTRAEGMVNVHSSLHKGTTMVIKLPMDMGGRTANEVIR
ncbi:two-component system, CitB family, sensor histidine kinase DctS [Lentibacillus halodurans]|uniref:histidine kinase n=1 Tax=Lentibacillus halodurans TaxID=237679 RepID=A0A1I0YFS8_9BACI|nr:sensor histidine kinase [Lentibacillus halodurans]SFB12042.1 two-component system, CitB family, sensor histidine kinase DctS [Lentibacillus halodurans]